MKRTPIYSSRDHLLNDTPIGVIELPDDVLQLLGNIAIELGGRLLLDVTKVDAANKQVLGFYLHPAPCRPGRCVPRRVTVTAWNVARFRSSTDIYLCRPYRHATTALRILQAAQEPVDG